MEILCAWNLKWNQGLITNRCLIVTSQISREPEYRALSDNSSCYIATELKEFLKNNHDMNQVHGRPMHPQTQGKIEPYHRTMKNVVKLDNYYWKNL